MSDAKREKRNARLRRHKRVRVKIRGTAGRPRLCVHRSLGHISAQIIDDDTGNTLFSASSLKLDLSAQPEQPGGDQGKEKGRTDSIKMQRSRAVGKMLAEMAVKKGITEVVFDRGGYLYHGRVAELAEAAREAGLEF